MINHEDAEDWLIKHYGDWNDDDPEWVRDMIEWMQEFDTLESFERAWRGR